MFHTALLAAAMTLPAPPVRRAPEPVTFDLFTQPKPETKPEEPKPEEPKPVEPKTKVAMREPTPAERERMSAPETTQPEPPQPSHTEPPASTNPSEKPGKVDLTLHALPGGGADGAVTIPSGPGSFGTTLGTDGAKKPWKMRGDAGNPLTGKVADVAEDRFPLKAIGGGEYMYKGKAFHARIARDGRVSFDDKSIRDFKGLSGGFDITDLLMRAKGDDPYRAEKKAFMDTTEAMRKKMAQAALKERVQESLAQVPGRLHQIWRDVRMTPAERRRLIYETWKDAAESDSTVDDAGREACATVEAFVRRYLPAGSEDAYTDEELQRYNRGQKLAFAPYR